MQGAVLEFKDLDLAGFGGRVEGYGGEGGEKGAGGSGVGGDWDGRVEDG